MIRLAVALGAVALALGVPASAEGELRDTSALPQLALMGTVPIYWGEADGLGELIDGSAPTHWARAMLERDYRLVPLDFLSADALAGHDMLLMAQPRALSPEENVALDAWVRDGGRLLLFADPMMTGESRFSIGDRRRAQDVALLSPILAHWGLELVFDENQRTGLSRVAHGETMLPVNLPGRFVPEDGRFECVISAEGLIAHCALDTGEVLLVADAAMLDIAGPYPGAEAGFAHLYRHLFGHMRENAGHAAHEATPTLQQGGGLVDSRHGASRVRSQSPP